MTSIDCLYYRAQIKKEEIVHFVALFRSIEDGIAFERIENPLENIFEFFVIQECENRFIEIMELFLHNSIVLWYKKNEIENSSIYDYK